MESTLNKTLILFLLSFLFNGTCLAQENRPPNIIIFLADDLGYGELGCQGNPQIPTPNIDRIAKEGVRFTQAYVTAPVCSPSRAGLITGTYQNRFGYETNLIGFQNEESQLGLPLEETTLAEHLLEAGYVSASIGKWHLGGTARYHPQRHGFDEFFGFLHEGHYFVPPPYSGTTTMLRRKILPGGGKGRWVSKDSTLIYSTHMGNNEPDYDANNPIIKGGQPMLETQYLSDAFTREAIDFIDRNTDKPFFLYLPYNAVHSPLQAADRFMEQLKHIKDIHRRIFAAMLANLDESVGKVMEKVRQEDLEERTLVFFLSDNGGPTKELTSSNLPLRGGKGGLYEGGIRIPFLMQWKGVLPEGTVYEKPVISLDIFATAVGASGGKNPPNRLDGTNLLPFLLEKENAFPHTSLYWSYRNKSAFLKENWKIVSSHPGWRGEKVPWELYNLETDISESNDLAEKFPQKLADMIQEWEDFLK